MSAEKDLNELAACVLDASRLWTGDAEAANPALKRARALAGLAIRCDAGMRWIDAGTLPPVHDDVMLRSENALCQTDGGDTLVGYVQYGMDGWDIDPIWIEEGRDMYGLEGVVRWVYVRDIVERIGG